MDSPARSEGTEPVIILLARSASQILLLIKDECGEAALHEIFSEACKDGEWDRRVFNESLSLGQVEIHLGNQHGNKTLIATVDGRGWYLDDEGLHLDAVPESIFHALSQDDRQTLGQANVITNHRLKDEVIESVKKNDWGLIDIKLDSSWRAIRSQFEERGIVDRITRRKIT